MNLDHWILAFLWILYFVIHSLLAATQVKLLFESLVGKFFVYYRLAYNIIATVTLLLILYFQYSFSSPVLIKLSILKYVAFIIFVCPGLIIMMASTIKYFKLLSGIHSTSKTTIPSELKLNGIHKYVRHPLYFGTLLFIWGLFFIFPMLNNLISVFGITIYIFIGLRFEEKKLIMEFGESYKAYRRKIPALFPQFKK